VAFNILSEIQWFLGGSCRIWDEPGRELKVDFDGIRRRITRNSDIDRDRYHLNDEEGVDARDLRREIAVGLPVLVYYPWVSSTSVKLTLILENKMLATRIIQVAYGVIERTGITNRRPISGNSLNWHPPVRQSR
jgi:hypothetical protein